MVNKRILGKWDFIFLLGESGGGKGTLVQNIRKYWLPEIKSASTGDIFREKAKTDPEIKRLTEEGILIDDKTVGELFREFAKASSPGIIDGFPRNRKQTLDAIKFIKGNGWRVLVIDLHCDIEIIIERLLARGRDDDRLSIMHKRNLDHKYLHPMVMEEIKSRHDLFDVITLSGNTPSDITFTNFLLDILRLVDLLYLYDRASSAPAFKVFEDETSVNAAMNRWLSSFLLSVQELIQ